MRRRNPRKKYARLQTKMMSQRERLSWKMMLTVMKQEMYRWAMKLDRCSHHCGKWLEAKKDHAIFSTYMGRCALSEEEFLPFASNNLLTSAHKQWKNVARSSRVNVRMINTLHIGCNKFSSKCQSL